LKLSRSLTLAEDRSSAGGLWEETTKLGVKWNVVMIARVPCGAYFSGQAGVDDPIANESQYGLTTTETCLFSACVFEALLTYCIGIRRGRSHRCGCGRGRGCGHGRPSESGEYSGVLPVDEADESSE